MEITEIGTNGLPLHEWAKGLRPEEMMQIDWVKKLIQSTHIKKLTPYNPAINIVRKLIYEIKKKVTDPTRREEQLKTYNRMLEKEMLSALINKDQKESKQAQLSN